MQEAQIRKLRRKPCGPMPDREREIGGRWSSVVLAVKRMSKPIRRTKGSGVWGVGGHDGWRVDPNHRIVSRGVGGPLDNVVRFVEAIELRQSQRAAVPLQRGETARFAFPTGFESEEAQLSLLYLDAFSVMFVLQ